MNNNIIPVEHRQFLSGKIEVVPRAIATIAAEAVRSVPGVVGAAPQDLRDPVAHALPWEEAYKGIDVQARGDRITIDVHIIVAYGAPIAEVVRKVREAVYSAAEHALGMPVSEVYVRIQGLQMQNIAALVASL